MSYFTLFTGKNRCKGETGAHFGGRGIAQYKITVVCDDEPLKLKTVVTYVYFRVPTV